MIGFAKRATAALMAVAVVFGTLFLEPVFNKDNTIVNAAALYDSASLVNYATIMGRAVDYGIVSRSFTQRQHIETTLATYKFCLEQNTVFDVDLTTSRTAQFMVGEIGGSQNKMIFDTVTHDQHPAYVENINITLADDIDMSKLQFNNPDKNHYSVNYTYLTKQQIYDAVDGVVSHAIDESAEIVARTHNPDYALESGAVTVDNGGCTIINIDDDKYENNVVYINLSNPEFATLWSKWNDPNNAGGNWLEIDKRSSTVVVFTYEGTDPITVGKTKVIAKDSAYYSSASQGSELQNYDYYTSVTTHSGEMSGHNYYVDNEIAQKVIWNITNSKQVNLNGSSGTFLILADDADVDLSNSPCSGWLVTNGHVVNRCEFHYIYTGANPNLISEGEGQMHFVAHKSFTTKYTDKDNINPYIDNSVYLSAGDYQFIWQEYTDATFKTPYGSSSVCPIDKNSMVDFPTVTVTSDNADPHYKVVANDNRNFYFRITEDPSKNIPGIANSAGYIDVCLNASADNNGHISFKVQSITTCGDNENNLIQYFENGKMNSADNWISVRGNRFDLGAFFNRKIVPGYMNITKTIKGDVTDEDLKGLTFTVTDGDKYTETIKLGEDFVKNASGVYELKTPITVQDAGRQYKVTETLHTVTGFDVTVSYTVGNTAGSGEEATLSGVSTKADEPTTVAFENDYVAKEMSLDISKATVLSEELTGATIELTGTDPHGKIVVFDESQFTRGKDARFVSAGSSLVFVSGTEASTISGLNDGTYKLHETLVPDSTDGTFTVATDINFKIEDGKIVSTDVNGTNNRYNPGNGTGNDELVLFDDFVKNTPTPTVTNSPTPTATNSPTPTATNSPTPTATNSPTPTATNSPTPTATNSPTPTATNSPTPTATNSPTPTATNSPTPTATNSPTPTVTETPVPTTTESPAPTATETPVPTATETPVPTATETPVPTATETPVPTATETPVPTATETPVPTATETPVPTATNTSVPTATTSPIPNATATPTAMVTPTSAVKPTVSVTPVITQMPDTNKDLEVTITIQDASGKPIPDTEITFTSLDGKDLSEVEVIQNGKEVTKRISDDKSSVTFITGDEGPSTIKGLDAGTYEVIEKNTSAEQTNPAKARFEIESDGSTVFNGKEREAGSQIDVEEQAGTNSKDDQSITMVLSADRGSSINREPNPIPATGETINEMLIATAIIVILGSIFLFGEGFKRKENKLHK
ncbi:MAG: hypothetical protein IIY21_27390 [Clostridiales bacterium]|nr:hypothetical protein [Clostridiales bacterium]